MSLLRGLLHTLTHDSYVVRVTTYMAILIGLMLVLTLFVSKDAALVILFAIVGVYVVTAQLMMRSVVGDGVA